jgi:hypothetical protein
MRELPCFADPGNLVGPEDELELFELAPGETSLSFLQKIYRSPSQPIARRMRAAMAALPFETPKLAVTTNISNENFAVMLDRAIARSQAPPCQIEHKADETVESVKWTGPLRDR